MVACRDCPRGWEFWLGKNNGFSFLFTKASGKPVLLRGGDKGWSLGQIINQSNRILT